jgi:hypothetical protein
MAGVPTPIKFPVLLSALENVTLVLPTIQVSYITILLIYNIVSQHPVARS